MPSLPAVPVRMKTWLAVVLLALGLAVLGWVALRPLPSNRVLILASSIDSLGEDCGPGMATLVADHLEVLAGATVTFATALPPVAELTQIPAETLILRFQGRRIGDLLSLVAEWNTASGVVAGKPWSLEEAPTQEPFQAMGAFVQAWPLTLQHHLQRQLVPRSPERFWALLEAMSIRDDRQALARLPRTQQLAQDEPACATAWTTLGDHLYRTLWVKPEEAGVGLNSRTHQAFQHAVDLVPGHPRATFLWSLMLTDTGNQSMALRALELAARLRPGSPDLYLGFAYSGRTVGLLEGARRALLRRKELLGPLTAPSSWFVETTWLYLGDSQAFSQELARAGSLRQDASILFYQGYFALLQGDRDQALGCMTRGSDPGQGPVPFRDLCRVYRAYLEGRHKEGLAELREIDEVRGQLRIPDGEWTFKEAEAYSLLGDADRGVDCATRAFVQGFSCAAWYEKSPFLARVRGHARWPMLQRNVRERQAVVAGGFPPASFAP